ncbi:MAG TPA: hypothetical protein VN408_18850 [Actinoplanes sp.]|nr:hypothetical protein [Actinoplanes sp.]
MQSTAEPAPPVPTEPEPAPENPPDREQPPLTVKLRSAVPPPERPA